MSEEFSSKKNNKKKENYLVGYTVTGLNFLTGVVTFIVALGVAVGVGVRTNRITTGSTFGIVRNMYPSKSTPHNAVSAKRNDTTRKKDPLNILLTSYYALMPCCC